MQADRRYGLRCVALLQILQQRLKADHGALTRLKGGKIMAKVNDTNRWAKNQLFYTFTAKRDFGRASGLDQAGIESKFQKACDEWAAHSGLTFTKSDGNADIIVSWGKIARKNGILPGGRPKLYFSLIIWPECNLMTIYRGPHPYLITIMRIFLTSHAWARTCDWDGP
jgi:hypothetical protein